jgi:thiol-disulfide isomerase/thioredoxin
MKHLFLAVALFCFTASLYGQTKKSGGKIPAKKAGMVSLSGKSFGPTELDGKVVVLNFWYTSCPPCLKEIPELNKLVEEYKGKDVVFLGFATDGKPSLERFLKENPFKYEIIPSATQLMLRFLQPDKNGNLETKFPTHIVVDREGKRTVYETGIKGIDALKKELARQFPVVESPKSGADN